MENPFLLRNAYMFGEMRSMQAITVVKNIILEFLYLVIVWKNLLVNFIVQSCAVQRELRLVAPSVPFDVSSPRTFLLCAI